ncbi:hypothetical protein D3C86_1992540 [compost metagenome]
MIGAPPGFGAQARRGHREQLQKKIDLIEVQVLRVRGVEDCFAIGDFRSDELIAVFSSAVVQCLQYILKLFEDEAYSERPHLPGDLQACGGIRTA